MGGSVGEGAAPGQGANWTGATAAEDFEEGMAGGVDAEFADNEGSIGKKNASDKLGHVKSGSKKAQLTNKLELFGDTVDSASKTENKQGIKEGKDPGQALKGSAEHPSLLVPENTGSEGGNIFLQTEHMVAAILMAVTMLRLNAEDRSLDRQFMTDLTQQKAEFQEVAAKMTKAQRTLEAFGQMVAGMMELTGGITTMVGGAVALGMGLSAAKQSGKQAYNKGKALSARNKGRDARAEASVATGQAKAYSQDSADLKMAQSGNLQKGDAKANTAAKEQFDKNATNGHYEVVAEGKVINSKAEDGSLNPEFTKAVEGGATIHQKGASPETQTSGAAVEDRVDANAAKVHETDRSTAESAANTKANEQSQRADSKEAKAAEHTDNASIAEIEAHTINSLSQAVGQIFQGAGSVQAGMGKVLQSIFSMAASDREYGASEARISSDLIDSLMKIVQMDIEDARDAVKKSLEVLQGIRAPSNKSANMRG